MDKQRYEMAQMAARLICEQGFRDYAQAKSRAALQLVGSERAQWPSNSEVAEAVLEHLRVFDADDWLERLHRLRVIALEAMRLTTEFNPRVVGAVVSGLATKRSPVTLHVFCPFDEALDFFLGDRNIPFDDEEVSLKHPDGREIRRPACVFMADTVEVQLVIFAEDDSRWSPLSGIDGRPMERWSAAQLESILADEASASDPSLGA